MLCLQNFTENGVQLGFPLPEALFRTNHGYDPTFLKTALSHISETSDSFVRYKLIHDTLVQYENTQTVIGDLQAVNITAVAGDKGGSTVDTFVTCNGTNSRTLLSVLRLCLSCRCTPLVTCQVPRFQFVFQATGLTSSLPLFCRLSN